jgi:hypothetical protein
VEIWLGKEVTENILRRLNKMGYFILFAVVFVTVALIKGKADKKKRDRTDYNIIYDESEQEQPERFPKISELNRKMDEKTAWLEADTQRIKQERERRKAAKEAEKKAKLEFKNRNK